MNDKEVKSWSYTPNKQVWLNNKQIKIKRNQKLEAKFFGYFQVLHPLEKQAYKLELLARRNIYNMFHLSLIIRVKYQKKESDK